MMKKNSQNYGTLLLLLSIFITPGISAYLLYANPQWLGSTTTNKGDFLKTPIKLRELGESTKWHMMVWGSSSCDNECQQQIDKLARVRLAMGRRLYDVESWLLLDENAPKLPVTYEKMLIDQDILVKRLPLKTGSMLDADKDHQIFIANSKNDVVLAFKSSAKPADIFHDMKQLLTTTEK